MFLTSDEIRNPWIETWTDESRPLERARHRMLHTGQWSSEQCMGRRWPVGCVALEITQRCNLDCTACYLSENSETVKDLPLDEVFRRIGLIRSHYGRDTDVQVTGGDPTLRRRSDLIAIVRRIRALGMRPALFTNGIRATPDVLAELAEAGLIDVAFHVDMTQRRRGYRNEEALNELRSEYIARTRGLPLAIYFNTTVFKGNLTDVPALARFFVRNSDVVRLASFQIQADVGRGTLRRCGTVITPDAVCQLIQEGVGTSLTFDAIQSGHAHCNRYAAGLVVNGSMYDLLDDRRLVARVLSRSARVQLDRQSRRRALGSVAGWLMRNPDMLPPIAGWFIRKTWAARNDLWRALGRVNKLSFFVHNFMDACRLESDRIDACAFMVAADQGPISMCLHNAKRDAFILKPLRIDAAGATRYWNPLSGTYGSEAPRIDEQSGTIAQRRKRRSNITPDFGAAAE